MSQNEKFMLALVSLLGAVAGSAVTLQQYRINKLKAELHDSEDAVKIWKRVLQRAIQLLPNDAIQALADEHEVNYRQFLESLNH